MEVPETCRTLLGSSSVPRWVRSVSLWVVVSSSLVFGDHFGFLLHRQGVPVSPGDWVLCTCTTCTFSCYLRWSSPTLVLLIVEGDGISGRLGGLVIRVLYLHFTRPSTESRSNSRLGWLEFMYTNSLYSSLSLVTCDREEIQRPRFYLPNVTFPYLNLKMWLRNLKIFDFRSVFWYLKRFL